jgi:phosphoglycolate phosphatase
MALKKPSVVLFDMDGTTVRHINPAILDILEWCDDALFGLRRIFFSKDKKVDLALENEYEGARPGIFVHRALHKFRRKPVNQIVRPAPGILVILKMLQEANIPIGLGSNGLGKGYGHDIIDQFGLEPYYKATVFREDVRRAKPHPELLLKLIDRMDIPLTKEDVIWHIGDRPKDIVSAMKLRDHLECEVVPIGYGINAALEVLKNGFSNTNIIMSYRDFAPQLKGIINN